MAIYTYAANLDPRSFVSQIFFTGGSIFIGDNQDLNGAQLAQCQSAGAMMIAGVQAVDLSKFPFETAKDSDGNFFTIG